MSLTDIARLCNHVGNFGAKQNWSFVATPVIVWEFATLSEFHGAKMALEKMIASEPYYLAQRTPRLPDSQHRTISPSTIEIDCYGLVFRLTCNQQIMTEQGPRGATEFKPFTFDFDALNRLRKGSSY